MSILQQLIALDYRLFNIINHQWSNDFFDNSLPYIREAMIWAPLYLFLLVLVLYNFGLRGFYWFIAALCTVALSDIISSHLVKGNVLRLRPCTNPLMAQTLILRLARCPGNYSFTSSHATNHFALAAFFFFTLQPFIKARAAFLFFVWAAAIGYAQVYVGAHYPLDVICGSLLGFFIGYGMSYIFNRKIGLDWAKNNPTSNE